MKDYSVLTSVYQNDKPEFVKIAIDSMLNQTLKPFQIVIVIDGKISRQLNKIISLYNQKYPKLFSIIKNKNNLGLGLALNEGLKYVKTDYIIRMDSDDYSSPQRAEKLLTYMQKNKEINILGSYIGEFVSNYNNIERIIKYPLFKNHLDAYNYSRDFIGHASVCIKTEVLKSVNGYKDLLFFEDTYLWLRLAKMKNNFHTIQEVLYLARIGNGFYERRSGFDYFKLEFKAFKVFKKEHLISNFSFYSNIFLRLIIRILPISFLKFIYKIILRSKNV